MTDRIAREIVEGPATASDGTVVLSGQVYLRAEKQRAETMTKWMPLPEPPSHNAEQASRTATNDDRPCETCNDDPEVCAAVPSLRHCEKAQRGNEQKGGRA